MFLNEISPYVEFAYFLAIFLLSINVYVQTRKMLAFSFHRGINYFRNAFLFFSMIYLFRFLVLNLQFLRGVIARDFETALASSGMFLVTYFSFLAIFSLLSSFLWKRYKVISDNRIALFSLVIACTTFFIRLPSILLILGVAVALFLVLKAYDSYRKKKQVFSPLFVIYALLLVFIIFDLVPITQELLQIEFKIAGYVGSICVFLYINMKVKKVLAAGKGEED